MLQHIATNRNRVAKRTQHVVPNNVARYCVEMLRAFGQALRGKNSTSALSIPKVDLNYLYLQFITNQLVIMVYDMSEFLFLHNIFKLKLFFLN